MIDDDFETPQDQFKANQSTLDALDAVPTDLMDRSRILKTIDMQLFLNAQAIARSQPAMLSPQDQERLIKTKQLILGKPTEIHKGMVYPETDLPNDQLDSLLREMNDASERLN